MKKKLLPVVALASSMLLAGCVKPLPAPAPAPEPDVPSSIHIYAPDGTPAMAIAGLKESLKNVEIECTLVQASAINTVFATFEDCDMAIMPTVSAAQIVSKGMDVTYVSANVWGNLYVVGIGGAEDISDLVGKVVYTTTGTTVALLEYELAANNIAFEMGTEASDGVVTIYTMNAASDYLPLIKQAQAKGGEAYGVLGEPAVTKCMKAVATESKIVVDMQAEYQALTGMDGYPQAGLVARGSFASKYAEFIEAQLVPAMQTTNEYLKANVETVTSIFESLGSTALLGIPYTAETFDRCNLRAEKDVKSVVIDYLNNMTAYVPALKGLELPESFFLFD